MQNVFIDDKYHFRVHLHTQELKQTRIFCILALILISLFGLQDYIVVLPLKDTTLLHRLWGSRIVVVLLLGVHLLLLQISRPLSWWNTLQIPMMTMEISLMITYESIILGGIDSSYFAAIGLVITGFGLLLPWSSWKVLSIGIPPIVVYAILSLFTDHYLSFKMLAEHLFYLFSTLVAVSVISHYKYDLIRTEFFQRLKIMHMHDDLRRREEDVEEELEIAGSLQKWISPPSLIEIRDACFVYRMERPGKVGGNFFDLANIGDERVAFLLASVSGHGVPAAFVTTMIKIHFAETMQHVTSPVHFLERLNRLLFPFLRPEDHVSAFLGLLESGGRFRYVNAGSNPPLLLRASGEVEELIWKGALLGHYPGEDLRLQEESLVIGEEERLLLFTDGAEYLRSPKGEFFGKKRMVEFLTESKDQPIELAGERLFGSLRGFSYYGFEEDMTFLLMEPLKRHPRSRKDEGEEADEYVWDELIPPP